MRRGLLGAGESWLRRCLVRRGLWFRRRWGLEYILRFYGHGNFLALLFFAFLLFIFAYYVSHPSCISFSCHVRTLSELEIRHLVSLSFSFAFIPLTLTLTKQVLPLHVMSSSLSFLFYFPMFASTSCTPPFPLQTHVSPCISPFHLKHTQIMSSSKSCIPLFLSYVPVPDSAGDMAPTLPLFFSFPLIQQNSCRGAKSCISFLHFIRYSVCLLFMSCFCTYVSLSAS